MVENTPDKNSLSFNIWKRGLGGRWGGLGETLFIMGRIDIFITRVGDEDGEINS